MNCARLKEIAAALLYGDVKTGEKAEAQKHLEACSVCRNEFVALNSVRQMLDMTTIPDFHVDLNRLYLKAGRYQEMRARRWRRAAMALLMTAATLLIAFALKWDLRFEGHQLVLRWGVPPFPAPNAPAPPPASTRLAGFDRPPGINAEDLQLLKDLVHALAADVEERDRHYQQALNVVDRRLETLRRQTRDHWSAFDRDVAALYADRFVLSKKGEKP